MKFGGKVLVVDDEAHIRKFVSMMIASLGDPIVLQAANGTEAQQIYEREKPHLVLLDLRSSPGTPSRPCSSRSNRIERPRRLRWRSSTIVAVLSQRLAARICDKCKESYYPTCEVLLKYFTEEGLSEVPFFRGRGCEHCRDTGYRGRVAFHELIVITEEIRQLISERKSVQEITRAAFKGGYRPLRYDGLNKVLLGLTTIEEIEENCSFELAE